jgi:hypothetical protein
VFKHTRALRLILGSALLASALLAPAVAMAATDESPDFSVAHDGRNPNGSTNRTPFWEKYLADNYGGTWDCTKFNLTTDPVVLPQDEDALIIKAGTMNYGWVPAPAGEYSPPMNSTSHYFICDQSTTVEDRVIAPQGDIGGPCADPAYYGIFDNTASTVPLKFRFRWYDSNGLNVVTKIVPAGAIYRTWEHWVSPNTVIRVAYQDPDTGVWITLTSETSVNGLYPPCEYQRGFEYPTS